MYGGSAPRRRWLVPRYELVELKRLLAVVETAAVVDMAGYSVRRQIEELLTVLQSLEGVGQRLRDHVLQALLGLPAEERPPALRTVEQLAQLPGVTSRHIAQALDRAQQAKSCYPDDPDLT